MRRYTYMTIVVPYIGTWIETTRMEYALTIDAVVPYIGTWIETRCKRITTTPLKGRTLYRYVD